MDARVIIAKVRHNHHLNRAELQWFARGLASGAVSDAQAGAFAMAVCQHGLTDEARVALTLGMRDSGEVLQWDLPGKVIDKHSTGGVGDAVSLLLAPMLAAAGAFVPMISGRGLGHTGGTLDKLEAIPGFQTEFSVKQFKAIVAKVGCAIVAPSATIAPADQRLYAVRDVTGTVRSLDLITSSILSKKLAAGLQALVLDVKTGSGAVMQDLQEAIVLAHALVKTANGAGCPTSALITDMNQPLLPSIGNAVEVADVMRAFESANGGMVDVAIQLGTQLLVQAHFFHTEKGARDQMMKTLTDGSAKAKFGEMVAAQKGPENFADRWEDYLTIAPSNEVLATDDGYIQEIDGTALGQIVVELGGGRQREDDRIDHSVGLSEIAPLGKKMKKGQPIALLHCSEKKIGPKITKAVQNAILLGAEAPTLRPLILERIAP